MVLRAALAGLVFTLIPVALGAEPEPSRKDAAESVGEGNTSRWLDYYRRERGQDWAAPPTGETKAPSTHPDETPRSQPSGEPAQSKPSRP